jgi:hypothetical protein
MNRKVTDLALKISMALMENNLVHPPPAVFGKPDPYSLGGDIAKAMIAVISKTLQPELFPEKCEGCGGALCPQCSRHMEDPLNPPESEFEAYPLCPYCTIYVLPVPDRTEIKVEQFDKDRRYVNLAEFMRRQAVAADEHPPKKTWEN